jgi:hypothetical protein
MTTAALLLLTAGSYLPGYALGQPLKDAERVVPIYTTAKKWRLRCTNGKDLPTGLQVSEAEEEAGVVRCWTMEVGAKGEQRAAYPLRGASRTEQELEFLHGSLVRIKIRRYYGPKDVTGSSSIWSKSRESDFIDSLSR